MSKSSRSRSILLRSVFTLFIFGSCMSLPMKRESSDEILFKGSRFKLRLLTSLYKPYRQYKEYVNESIVGMKFLYPSVIYGKERDLSGIILLPKKAKYPCPLLLYCHGTMFDQTLAPSMWSSAVELEALPAMDGYITIIPDYLGYGSSSDQIPTYFDQQATTTSIMDMLWECLSLFEERQMPYRKELFILGYSQGGHAALSLVQELQMEGDLKVDLMAAVSIAGPFQLKENVDFILGKDEFATSAYVSYLFTSLNHYHWRRDISDFFQVPYSDYISDYIAGNISLNAMAVKQSPVIKSLMEPSFLTEYLGTGEIEIKQSLRANSDFNFVPKIPLHIIHSRTDEDVPFATSHQTWQKMITLGADSTIVTFQSLDDASHSDSALMGIPLALEYFRQFRKS